MASFQMFLGKKEKKDTVKLSVVKVPAAILNTVLSNNGLS